MSLSNRCRPIAGHLHLSLFLLIAIVRRINAQQSPSNDSLSPRFNTSTIIIILLLASSFLFLTFFTIYIRHCPDHHSDILPTTTNPTSLMIFEHQGLNPEILFSFPTMPYSEVKHHRIAKTALECAICINEFEDEDTLRLLPECDHVFHLDCIDAWLDTHLTCPVCRTNYFLYSPNRDGRIFEPPEQVLAVDVDDEMWRCRKVLRSYSMGHGMVVSGGEGSLERYTLRLPEGLRKEIFDAGRMKKARALVGEENMRKISRGGFGEGSSRRGRTIHLGRSDPRPSFFSRSLSARISTFGNWRRGEEGEVGRS